MNRQAKTVTDSEMGTLLFKYQDSLRKFEENILAHKTEHPRYQVIWAAHPFSYLIRDGVLLAQAILGSREIPPGKTKAMELAARLVMSSKRTPLNPSKWWETNQRHLVLLENAAKWPAKTEGGASLFKLGPFTVHNTVGATADLEPTKKALERAIQAIEKVPVPGIRKVLYGDVYIAARLQKASVLAWYYMNEDALYVRPHMKAGPGEVHALIHELGHRFYKRFLSGEAESKWETRHMLMARFSGSNAPLPPLPKPGDIFPIQVKGEVGLPVVKEITFTPRGKRVIMFESGGGVLVDSFYSYAEKENTISSFPTRYAATSAEEHFCEALALRALGQLEGKHLKDFERIIEGKEQQEQAMNETFKTAMASSYVEITREMLEDWLDTFTPHVFEKWYRRPNTQGIYYIPLSKTVAVKLSSTIGSTDVGIAKGKGSMQLALVSRVTDRVINKVAQGQGHFARTTNWEKTWKEGVGRMHDAYLKSQGFYDALAGIVDRAKYKADILEKIQSVPEWEKDQRLSDWYRRVFADGILTDPQIVYIDDKIQEAKHRKAPTVTPVDEKLLQDLKELWKKAKMVEDTYTMDFCKNVAETRVKRGIPLTGDANSGQQGYLAKIRRKYQIN